MEALGIVFLVAVVGIMGYVAWLRQRQISASAATIRELRAASERASESLVAAGLALTKLDESLQAGMARLGEHPSPGEELFLLDKSRRGNELLRQWMQARSTGESAMPFRLFVCRAESPSLTQLVLNAHGGLRMSAVQVCSREYGPAYDFPTPMPGRADATYNPILVSTPSFKVAQESCWQEWVELLDRPIREKRVKLRYPLYTGFFSCGVSTR